MLSKTESSISRIGSGTSSCRRSPACSSRLRFSDSSVRASTRTGCMPASSALMVSGILRALEVFSSQQAWDNPDLYWMSLMNLVNWVCNVMMPLYGVLQIVVGIMHFAGVGHRIYQGGSWMRHFVAAAGCFMLSGMVRLAEWFVQQGTGGVS